MKALNEEKSGRGTGMVAELANPVGSDEEFEGYDDEDQEEYDEDQEEYDEDMEYEK